MKTTAFQWKDEFSVGLEVVDKQHKQFLKIINDLGDCIAGKDFKEKGHEIFFSLVHFADTYLMKEKMLVNSVDEIDYSFFRQKHKEFLKQLLDFQKDCEAQCSEELYITLYNYLKKTYPEYLSYYTPTLVDILKNNGVK